MPPAYEVLLLNTAIPQIQAAQSGDTYVVPRDIAINATAIISANSATDALRITQTGAGNAILVEDSANPDSTPFVVTAVGDVGIGTSLPSTKLDVVGAIKATAAGASLIAVEGGAQNFALIQMQATSSGGKNWSLVSNATSSPLGAAGSLSFRDSSAGVTYMTLDSSGNLGLGVTPSAWSIGKVLQFGNGASIVSYADNAYFNANAYFDSGWKYLGNAAAGRYEIVAGAHAWYRSTSAQVAGTDPVFSQAMTLDASGNLLVGTTSANGILAASGRGYIEVNGTTDSAIGFESNNTLGGYLYNSATEFRVANYSNNPLTFHTNNTERARITSGGYFKASDNGAYFGSGSSYHELRQTANSDTLVVSATNASYTGSSIFSTATKTAGTDWKHFYGTSDGNTVANINIFGNGNITNTNGTYGTISDAKMKTDIVDAGSQWSDIKALRFRKFKMKDDPSGLVQLGVVAQEVEQTSPGLVDEHADKDAEGNDLGTTTKSVKTSVLLMKAAVALQEAMARIEQLESKVAALEAK